MAKEKKETQNVSVRWPLGLYRWLKEEADKNVRTFNQQVIYCVKLAMHQIEHEKRIVEEHSSSSISQKGEKGQKDSA